MNTDPILGPKARDMKHRLFLILGLILASALAPTGALADIELSPLRQVLTAENREVRFIISNPSKRILDGQVSWIDMSATETGYAPATPEQRTRLSAAPYLTVSPAQFRLNPGERREIVVRLRDEATPPEGERRSHLLIETGAARTLIRKASDKGLQVDIEAGISAPVIIRGDGKADASIENTKLLRDSEGMLLVSTMITPSASYSTYGKLTASFSPADPEGKRSVLGIRENVTGYTDTEHRLIEIPLGFFSLGAGELTLRYEGAGEFAGRVFDERKFDIAPPK
ncbi:MAG: hypothetical protein DHS20C05_18860 [Hyphococcus sp.]|nr:MAG: hypothetical protein DHS20C05_18860 [Marinicaulis sp.]